MRPKVLIVDDEEKIRVLLSRIIGLEGYETSEAGSCKSALKRLESENVDIVICDVKLPDGNGVDLVKKIKEKSPITEVILLTAYGNLPDGILAIKNGAFDYITKGDDNIKIVPLLNNASEKIQLAKRIRQLEKQIGIKYTFEDIISKSKPMLAALELAQKVANTQTSVLLTGETGTGKELFAQAIHFASSRKDKPFLALNCATFNKDLLESELFGYKAGAFTGAIKEKKGLMEIANHGTLFLDELGEMPLDLQAKLLRVLDSGVYIKVGDTEANHVDIRIISATNRNLSDEIRTGRFRQDLYYRLSVFEIQIPPLRERVIDIELLATHFMRQYSYQLNRKITGLSPELIERLKTYTWPGNIRELRNIIERCVILCDEEILSPNYLPKEFQSLDLPNHKGKQLSAFELAGVEKLHIRKVYNYTNGNKTETAKLLNIALSTLYRKLDEYDIN